MTDSNNVALNSEDIRKLDAVIKAGVEMKEKHKLERDSLKEAVDAVAESCDLKTKNINKAIATAFKADYSEAEQDTDEVMSILQATGRM